MSIPVSAFSDATVDEASVVNQLRDRGETVVTDGMIVGLGGAVLHSALEQDAIVAFTADDTLDTVVHDPLLSWPDSFALSDDGWLYVTTSRIHESTVFGGTRTEPYRVLRIPVRWRPPGSRLIGPLERLPQSARSSAVDLDFGDRRIARWQEPVGEASCLTGTLGAGRVTAHTVPDGPEPKMEESMVLSIDFSKLDAQDVLDLAIHVEQEAEDNYEQLASWMEADDNHEVARFFSKMAGLERRHRDQLAERRQQLFGDAPPRHSARAVWEVEQPDYDALGDQVSLEQAFELAMGAERQAGEYYTTALEYASDQDVIALFEGLKKAEEEHLRLLREQRTKALGTDSRESR